MEYIGTATFGRGLNNVALKAGIQVDFTMRLKHGGELNGIIPYIKTDPATPALQKGYSGGDGGTILCTVREANGPEAASFILGVQGMTPGNPATVNFPRVKMFGTIKPDSIYHFVFQNLGADANHNFVSLNGLDNPGFLPQPFDPTLMALRKIGEGPWTSLNLTPIFQVQYVDSFREGQGFTDARSDSGLVALTSHNLVRLEFTLDKMFPCTKLGIYAAGRVQILIDGKYKLTSSPGALGWSILPTPFTALAAGAHEILLSNPEPGLSQIFPLVKGPVPPTPNVSDWLWSQTSVYPNASWKSDKSLSGMVYFA